MRWASVPGTRASCAETSAAALVSTIERSSAATRQVRTVSGKGVETALSRSQRVATVLLPDKAPGFAQRFEREHHFAPVAARGRGDRRFEGLRAVDERRFDRSETLALEARRFRNQGFDSARF